MSSHQHGLHSMNESRPKSKDSKKLNKAKAKVRKAPLLEALHEARYGGAASSKAKTTITKESKSKSATKKPVTKAAPKKTTIKKEASTKEE